MKIKSVRFKESLPLEYQAGGMGYVGGSERLVASEDHTLELEKRGLGVLSTQGGETLLYPWAHIAYASVELPVPGEKGGKG